MAKLNTYVNVDGAWYGPDDDVPAKVASQIRNPKVWADGEAPTTADGDTEVKEPPRGGPGSGADAWREFLQSQNVDVPDGATQKDMQALWDERK